MSNTKTYRLGDICQVLNGRAYKQEELLDSGKYRVLRVGNFFSNGSWYYSDLELEENKYCETGDLLFAWSASFGPKIWEGEKTIYHYHIWKMIPNELFIDKMFLYYLLKLRTYSLLSATHGSIMLHITKDFMENLMITIPEDVSEQKKIALKLSQIDNKIDINNKICSELESTAKEIYEYRFTQFNFPDINGKPYRSSGGKMVRNEELNREIPEGWGVTSIGSITCCHDSERIPVSNKDRENMKGDIPYYGATSIMGYVNKAIFSGDYVLLAEDGSVMDENGNPIIQRVSGDIWVNNHAHVLEPINGYSCRLLMMILKDIPVVKIKTGSIQMKINQKNLNNYKILNIPNNLIDSINKYLDIIDKKLLEINAENQQLTLLRDFLLPMLINGQVTVK